VRGLWQHRVDALLLDDVAQHGCEVPVVAGRHERERVAHVAAYRAPAEVGADDPHVALAVLS
jgi:hypothetical protein